MNEFYTSIVEGIQDLTDNENIYNKDASVIIPISKLENHLTQISNYKAREVALVSLVIWNEWSEEFLNKTQQGTIAAFDLVLDLSRDIEEKLSGIDWESHTENGGNDWETSIHQLVEKYLK